jgi:GT2 family glycosyltransferase
MTWLKACLDSCIGYNVIVVDNASVDNTLQFISDHYPDVIQLPQKENLGFGAANNIGISYALNYFSAEYVYLLNQDAYLVGDTIQDLINKIEKNIEYGILSPIHITADKNNLDKKFKNYLFKGRKDFSEKKLFLKESKTLYDVSFINAAGWLVTRECLLNVGGFDPIFFLYGEDDNFCQRVLYHGFKIGVVSNVYMIHDRSNREQKEIDVTSDEFLKIQANIYKVKYANINEVNIEEKLNEKLKYLRKQFVKNLILLKFDALKESYLKYKLLIENKDKIQKSYSLNKTKAPHYLST